MDKYPIVRYADGTEREMTESQRESFDEKRRKYIAVCEAIQGAENALTDDAKVEAGKLLVKAMYPFMPETSSCCCGGY